MATTEDQTIVTAGQAAAMTEDQLVTTIEDTMRAAHLSCQPYFLALVKLWLPGVTQARAMSSVTSRPLGGNAAVEAVSFSLKEVLPTPAAG
jgi:hypothetical protein